MKNKELVNFYLKYKLVIFPLIVVLSCLILIFAVIFPQLMGLLSSQTTEGELANRAKFLEAKAQTLQSYDEGNLSTVVSSILNAYPSDKDYANVLFNLQSITSKWGFVIVAFNVSGSDSKIKGSQSYALSLDVSGPRALLPSLLNEIENAGRIMRVDAIDVSGGKDAGTVTVSLGILALYAPTPNSFGNVDSPIPELSAKDEEVIAKLSSSTQVAVPTSPEGAIGQEEVIIPTGKANPFE